MPTKGKPVLVTTERRGVFFGYLKGAAAKKELKLTKARNCVYWSRDVRGFAGLASHGPNKNCRVGPCVPEMTLYDITAVVVCTPEAVEAWEKSPWS